MAATNSAIDGSAGFAIGISDSEMVGVAVHELNSCSRPRSGRSPAGYIRPLAFHEFGCTSGVWCDARTGGVFLGEWWPNRIGLLWGAIRPQRFFEFVRPKRSARQVLQRQYHSRTNPARPHTDGCSRVQRIDGAGCTDGERAQFFGRGKYFGCRSSTFVTGITNPNNDSITEYEFMNTGSDGHLTNNGVNVQNGQWVMVAAGSVGGIDYVGGATPGSDTLEVAVLDATTGSWSASSALTATTTALHVTPTVNVRNFSVAENTWFRNRRSLPA